MQRFACHTLETFFLVWLFGMSNESVLLACNVRCAPAKALKDFLEHVTKFFVCENKNVFLDAWFQSHISKVPEVFIDPNLEFLRRAQKFMWWSFCIYFRYRIFRGISAYYAEYPSMTYYIIRAWILCAYTQMSTAELDNFCACMQILHKRILCEYTQNRNSCMDIFCVRPQILQSW